MTESEVAARAASYTKAAGLDAPEETLLTCARRALAEAASICGAPAAPDSLLEETAALAAGYCLMLPQDTAQGEAGAQAVSVKEGDTQVQFSEAETPGALRRRLAEELTEGARRDCARWRRLIW